MSVIHTQITGIPFVKCGKSQRMVDTTSLTPGQKQAVWRGIKRIDPELADALKTDPNIDALKQQLNATVQFTVNDFNQYLQAGLNLEERKP